MKVLMIASEVKPFSVSGGLGDVIGALPNKLKKVGTEVRVISPLYSGILKKYKEEIELEGEYEVNYGHSIINTKVYKIIKNEVIHYFISQDFFFNRINLYGFNDDFNRFAFFSKAVLDILKEIDYKADILHCNDWQTALVPVYLNKFYKEDTFYKNMKVLFTIHNLQYQGIFNKDVLPDILLDESYFNKDSLEFFGSINFLKGGLIYSDFLNTVSTQYSKEIQTEEYGFGLAGVVREQRHKLVGIVNGIDYENNNPATDDIEINFDAETAYKKYEGRRSLKRKVGLEENDLPVVAVISRLAHQKGISLIPFNIKKLGVQLVVLGTGESDYEDRVRMIEQANQGYVKAILKYDQDTANELYAYSDMFLMPSLFEPCGLGQLYAMRYGAVPIVRNTGGLRDTVNHFDENTMQGEGIVFNDCLESAVIWGIEEAVRLYNDKEKWNTIVKNGMNKDFSWEASAKEYNKLYKTLID